LVVLIDAAGIAGRRWVAPLRSAADLSWISLGGAGMFPERRQARNFSNLPRASVQVATVAEPEMPQVG